LIAREAKLQNFPTLPDILGGADILDALGLDDELQQPADGGAFADEVTDAAHRLPDGGPEPGLYEGSLSGAIAPTDFASGDMASSAATGNDAPNSFAPGLAIEAFDGLFTAKGGVPGGNGGGGGGGGGGNGGGKGGGNDAPPDYWSGSADGEAGFDILIDFVGSGWTADLVQAFTQAADYFTTVITDDIGGGDRYRGTYIDDLYVSAELASIDGPSGILGQAGPTAVWTESNLTASGVMQFDVADAEAFAAMGLWDEIVTHEMMHVLGFGSLWNYNRELAPYDLLSGEYQYVGENALAAYQKLFDPTATYIPVESSGFGAGTDGSHWDESVLQNELMTGFLNTSMPNILSEVSVMALADLGYQIDYQDYPFDEAPPLA
jgi:hypothetical protein